MLHYMPTSNVLSSPIFGSLYFLVFEDADCYTTCQRSTSLALLFLAHFTFWYFSPFPYLSLHIIDWMNELQQNTPPGGLVIAMCATKCDLAMNPDTSQAEALAARAGAMFITTSAKTNTNVNYLFLKLTERVLRYQQRNEESHSNVPAVSLGSTSVETGNCVNLHKALVSDPSTSDNMKCNRPSPSTLHVGSRIGLTLLPSVQENNGDTVRSPVGGKRQRPEADDNIHDSLDPATTPSGDSENIAANVARCDPHSMLMCGGVDSADNVGRCFIQ
jgi:hypothetical protein